MGSSTPLSSVPPRGSGRSKGSAAQPHLARLPCGKGAGRRKAVSPRQGTKDSARCAAELICGGAAPLFCRKAALTYFCSQRPRFFLPQGEASSAPHSLFPREKRTGRLAVQEKSARGMEDECPTGRLDAPPGPPDSPVRAIPARPVNHPATHFGYAARGCGGGRVPRSKAPPQLGESGE